MTNSSPQCSVCDKSGTFRCSSCKTQVYCGEACQRSDWKTHKQSCSGRPAKPWYDDFRRCDDGSFHEGKLELITWDCPEEETGWGHILKEESDDLKRKFEGEFGGSEAKLCGDEVWM
ncbi:hypothetical protein ONZ45_g3427 [Pleurotus djamor]|nr:hypothetical protein ONZ45_g3427 [Pleurotus djamor]